MTINKPFCRLVIEPVTPLMALIPNVQFSRSCKFEFFRVSRGSAHYTRLYYTIPYSTILHYTILYYTILLPYYTVLCNTITILYYTILYYVILYYTM